MRSRLKITGLLLAIVALGANAPSSAQTAPGARDKRTSSSDHALTPMASTFKAIRANETDALTVIHRLRGLRLLWWLAREERAPVIFATDRLQVHSNVVAGRALADGTSVVARLPNVEAEFLPLPQTTNLLFPDRSDSEFIVIRPDGAQFNASLVNFDSLTGLSLLKTSTPLFNSRASEATVSPPLKSDARSSSPPHWQTGYTVRLLKPKLAEDGVPPRRRFHLEEIEASIATINRSDSGEITQAFIQAARLSPTFAGAIALAQDGSWLGIVGRARAGEASLIPAQTIKQAIERLSASASARSLKALSDREAKPVIEGGAPNEPPTDSGIEGIILSSQAAAQLGLIRAGLFVLRVRPKSRAECLGLRAGDIIETIDGVRLTPQNWSTFIAHRSGSKTVLGILRDARRIELGFTADSPCQR